MGSTVKIDMAKLVSEAEAKDDPRQAYASVLRQVRELQEAGDPVPDDLIKYQRLLMTELSSMSQGR